MKLIDSGKKAMFAVAVLMALGLGMFVVPSAKAQSLTPLYTFCSLSGCADGAYPYAALTQGPDGDYYGTTEAGGTGAACAESDGCGTVFKITPAGALTTLYSFCSQTACADGKHPYAGLILASDGNFYGTTFNGGNYSASASGSGTVFKITPDGALTTLYSFCSQQYCADGGGPYDSLVQGSDGNFYGSTSGGGGPYGLGTVFKITPDSAFTSLYSFCDHFECAGIGDPQGGLVQGGDGNLYGTTGGVTGGTAYSTVFRITPSGALTYIYSFCQLGSPCVDGFHPTDTLTVGRDGNLYGTTLYGGANQGLGYEQPGGTVFSVTTSGAHTVLYSFCGVGTYPACTDGADPVGGLVQASDGNFYGTTSEGGAYHSGGNGVGGTIFKITPAGALTTLYSFCAQVTGGYCTDGSYPFASLIQGSDANFYGTTSGGGAGVPGTCAFSYGCGTVFRLYVPPVANVSPASFTFTAQNEGTTSPSQAVTLSNTGPAALSISSIGPPSGDFGETHNCPISPATLAAGSSCTINVTFTPTATGTRSGTLTITDNSNGVSGSQQTVTLTGTGINPAATFSAASVAFGDEEINTPSGVKKVKLTSSGTTNLSTPGITIAGANTADFSQTNTCTAASYAPAATCTISVKFTPSLLAAESASLVVTDNAANSPQTVALTGTGVMPVVLSPTSLSFGNIDEGVSSATKTVTMTNYQKVALTGISVSTSSAGYTQTNTCGTSIDAGKKCTITVTFTPSIIGTDDATLSVSDSASNSPQTVALTGTGLAPVKLTPASETYPSQTVGTTSTAKVFTLTSYLSTTLSSIVISTTGDFAVSSTTCTTTLAAKGKCTIDVVFTPSATGTRTGTLSVSDSAANSPQTSTLKGTGK
jgi:uncharacterized repeat protein (TIGR03803 family)